MEKKNIVVLFGGQSSEHVVSCMSVQNVVANITTGKDVYGALAYNQEKVDRGDGKGIIPLFEICKKYF